MILAVAGFWYFTPRVQTLSDVSVLELAATALCLARFIYWNTDR
jgi:hypothetical protein